MSSPLCLNERLAGSMKTCLSKNLYFHISVEDSLALLTLELPPPFVLFTTLYPHFLKSVHLGLPSLITTMFKIATSSIPFF